MVPVTVLEPGYAVHVARERFRENLEGDVAIQSAVARPVDFAHAAGPE